MSDGDAYQRINLRIPRELHERLISAAKSTSKSMNAEIVARLSESFRDIRHETSWELSIARLTQLADRLEGLESMKEQMNALRSQAESSKLLFDQMIAERNEEVAALNSPPTTTIVAGNPRYRPKPDNVIDLMDSLRKSLRRLKAEEPTDISDRSPTRRSRKPVSE